MVQNRVYCKLNANCTKDQVIENPGINLVTYELSDVSITTRSPAVMNEGACTPRISKSHIMKQSQEDNIADITDETKRCLLEK